MQIVKKITTQEKIFVKNYQAIWEYMINSEATFFFLLTLSGAHFSVKLILAINGNLEVFGVANHDSGIRFAKLKMADPRW